MYIAGSKRLTLAGAKKIMPTATALGERADVALSVVIVDAGGHVILAERMDGGRFHTVHSAMTNAVRRFQPAPDLGTGSRGPAARYVARARTSACGGGRALDRPGRWQPDPGRDRSQTALSRSCSRSAPGKES